MKSLREILLNEGTTDSKLIKELEKVREKLGDEEMLNSILWYLSTDQMSRIIKLFKQEYDEL